MPPSRQGMYANCEEVFVKGLGHPHQVSSKKTYVTLRKNTLLVMKCSSLTLVLNIIQDGDQTTIYFKSYSHGPLHSSVI